MSTQQDSTTAPLPPEGGTPNGVKRREFLKVIGAGTAATAMLGCASEKVEKLIPYLVSPDETVPGVSTYYATTCRECSAACGTIAETRDGRAIKLEGNPSHPVNRGALCARWKTFGPISWHSSRRQMDCLERFWVARQPAKGMAFSGRAARRLYLARSLRRATLRANAFRQGPMLDFAARRA